LALAVAWLCSLTFFTSSASLIFFAFLIIIFLFLPDADELTVRSHLDLDLLAALTF
jgi:hypothetical protein